MRSVSLNWRQLMMTFCLVLIVMYIYATVFFFYQQETVYDYNIRANDSDRVGENRCTSMFECFMTVVYIGLILGGGIGDYTEQIYYGDRERYLIKLTIDVSFFLLVKIILYNILMGIIIDTFAQLREEKSIRDDDIKNKCYICNFSRFVFDKEAEGGFYRHVHADHRLWNYVYYIVHLQSKDSTDYTGIESYVNYKYKWQDTTWLPRQKALCLERVSGDDEEENEELNHFKEEIKQKSDVVKQFTSRIERL